MYSQESLLSNNKLTTEKRTEAKTLFYKLKLKYESIMKIVDGMKKEIEAREAKKDSFKLTETEKESIGKLIEKYQA
jgi:ribonuclease HII